MNNIQFDGEWDELCPIFFSDEDVFEQIGTGVLINIFDNVYLLTASHVIDNLYNSKGARLLIPTVNGFSTLGGTLYHKPLQIDEHRDYDKIDFSFCKLSSELIETLHEDLVPLSEHKIGFLNDYSVDRGIVKKRVYDKNTPKNMKILYGESSSVGEDTIDELNDLICETTIVFAGFPNTKSKSRNGIHETEIVYYYGRGLSNQEYILNNYDKTVNILAEHGKYGVMDSSFNLKNSPKPYGISGGGIYKIVKTNIGFDRQLIGIGHTYKKRNHLFVGTHINYCIQLLKKVK